MTLVDQIGGRAGRAGARTDTVAEVIPTATERANDAVAAPDATHAVEPSVQPASADRAAGRLGLRPTDLPHTPVTPLTLVALLAAVAPAVVMAARAVTEGWVPLFDAAYFTVRSRDVATAHNPLVGAWSMGSREVGDWINNLGPMQLDLLAPFTKLDPYWGTAVGVAAVNTACVVGVWLVTRRMFATTTVAAAMAATLLIELNLGSLMLIEARQQLALVLPMWLLLWLAAGVIAGDRALAPWLVAVASLVLQTHFTYAYQTLAVTAAAVVAMVWQHRRRRIELRRPLIVASLVALACWALPLWDQVSGAGNLGAVLGQSGGSQRSLGHAHGARILAETGFVPPFFVPGSMGDLLRRGERPSTTVAVLALAVTGALTVLAVRRTSGPHRALAATAFVVLAASVHAAAKIPPTEQFGVIAQNYYWAWPVGIFVVVAIAAAAAPLVVRQWSSAQRALPAVTAAGCVAAAVPLLAPTNQLPETSFEWDISRRAARPLIDELSGSLDGIEPDTKVLVDLGDNRHVRYTMLAELQRHDIDFRFTPGSTDLSRFGAGRCDDGEAVLLLSLRSGRAALNPTTNAIVMAQVDGQSSADRRRLDELATLFGDAIRSGRVRVDRDRLDDANAPLPAAWAAVIGDERGDATGLAGFIIGYRGYGIVVVDETLADELDEFGRLEAAADRDAMTIVVEPIPGNRPNWCGVVAPGERTQRELEAAAEPAN